ncbi:glutathione peroxidase [Pseudoxanthomonas kalamensis]|uniref:glutathione peroxidase n=1 Tax=Pseudoxanthomonas kalamensis TaxID=289483 RepID=UPI002483D672|nr:glutathione peroxidase [Pseudoxanthomonas kalamensis]
MAEDIDGQPVPMDRYRGKLVLVVNVASKCGFTPQYAALEALWQQFGEHGLVVLGFPCDQFGHQEPGDEAQIREFCSLNFGVSFPMFAKVEVNGAHAHPLWTWLQQQKRGLLGSGRIKWNFTKFLVDGEGRVIARHAPVVKPEKLAGEIAAALGAAA